MNSEYSASEIREFVVAAFSRLTRRKVDPLDLIELILIKEGVYRGRSYRWCGWMAHWMLDVQMVMFYDAHGDLAHTVDLRQPEPVQQRAA